MKKIRLILFIAGLVLTSQVYGKKISPKAGTTEGVLLERNWATNTNWEGNVFPAPEDTVVIKKNTYLIINLVKAQVAGFIIEEGAAARFGSGTAAASLPSLIINGDLIINEGAFFHAGGNLTSGAYPSGRSLTVNGNLINNGEVDFSRINSATAGTMPYENAPNVLTMGQAAGPTSISGTGSFVGTDGPIIRFLTINNSHGVTLNASVNIPQGLNLVNGELKIGDGFNLTLDNTKFAPSSSSGVTMCRVIRSQSSSLNKPFIVGPTANLALEYVNNLGTASGPITEGHEMPASRTISRLTINNGQGLNLLDDVTLTGTQNVVATPDIDPIILTEGVINLPAGKFIKSTNPTRAGAAGSATSYINGGFALALNTTPGTRTFPIGANGQNKKVVLSGVSGDDNTLVSFSTISSTAGTAGTDVTDISNRRWVGTVSNGNLIGYSSIALDFSSNDGAPTAIDRLALSATEAGAYNAVLTTGATSPITSVSGGTTLGYFALANNNNTPLPVNLISFNAEKEYSRVKLSWSTASEEDNNRFEVERSLSGSNFIKITEVKAGNQPSQLQKYVAYDFSPLSATNYYRLVQYDNNGTKTILSTKAVDFGMSVAASGLTVYPNPSINDILYIEINNVSEGSLSAVITDLQGKIIQQQAFQVKNGQFKGEISLAQKPSPGVYLLNVSGKNLAESRKILIN